MIRYVGGKTRLAKDISAAIYIQKTDKHRRYLEPFFGGGSMAQYTKHFGLSRYAYDIHTDLIAMYRMLQVGWLPPKDISEERYKEVQASTAKDNVMSALRGYVGFACSFGGKWFGGYARDAKGTRRLDHESYNRIVKHLPDLEEILFNVKSYEQIRTIHDVDLIYCDPPYEGTLGYKENFDHTLFWNTMRQWSNNGAAVLISEYTAPDDFKSIWEKPRKTYMHHKATNNEHIEHLYMWKG